jgi:hypothetical protein
LIHRYQNNSDCPPRESRGENISLQQFQAS